MKVYAIYDVKTLLCIGVYDSDHLLQGCETAVRSTAKVNYYSSDCIGTMEYFIDSVTEELFRNIETKGLTHNYKIEEWQLNEPID